MLYPVRLRPLSSSNLQALDKLVSPGTTGFAVISENKIIAKAFSAIKLGIEYQKLAKDRLDRFNKENSIEFLAEECPIKILNTGKEIYSVRSIGDSNMNAFKYGMLFGLENKD